MFSYLQRDLEYIVIEVIQQMEDRIHEQICSGALFSLSSSSNARLHSDKEDIPGYAS